MFKFLTLLIFANALVAEIIPIQKLLECSLLDNLNESDLVVFDVDDVLITPADVYLHTEFQEDLYAAILNVLAKAKTPDEVAHIFDRISLLYLLPERILVENDTPSLIKDLQAKGIKTIALTSCDTGKFGKVDSIQKWRIEHLLTFGIDFSSSFPIVEPIWFPLSPYKKPALFENGILFSKGYKKSEVLLAFLNKYDLKPARILFFDDLLENHEDLEEALNKEGIRFIGLHYLGAKTVPRQVDPAEMQQQIDYLIDQGVWLSEK
jgi:hypothetical protein